jgi:hypothetical protein
VTAPTGDTIRAALAEALHDKIGFGWKWCDDMADELRPTVQRLIAQAAAAPADELFRLQRARALLREHPPGAVPLIPVADLAAILDVP